LRKERVMNRKRCFDYIAVTPVLMAGAAMPQTLTKEVNNEPTY
jgi:hypothetical protein